MRYVCSTATILVLVVGFAFAQSDNIASAPAPNPTQSIVQPADKSDVLSRLDALERKLEQLENRVNAVLPASPAAAPNGLSERLDALDQKLDVMEHNARVKEGPSVTAGRDTFSISSPDKTYRLRIGGHLQLDGKTFVDNPEHLVIDAFNIRRARPIFEGSLGKYVDFRFMPDFGNGQSLVYDAYADVKLASTTAVLRGGKFKTPLGLEQLQNDADLTFIERSLATDLVPNRDEGFELYGESHRLSYQAAVINGAPDGANIDGSTHSGKDVVGRLFATPFGSTEIKALNGLGFGIAASSGRQDEGATLPIFRSTGGQAVFFTYGGTANVSAPFAAGRRVTYSPQLYYYTGPFGLMAEYVDSAQKIGGTTAAGQTIVHDIDNHAWQVAGSWVITGEKKSYKSLAPRNGFEGGDSAKGLGAWELVARYSQLNVDAAAFADGFADPAKSAKAARAWIVGVNWYLNYFAKLQIEYEQTRFERGAAAGNRPTEHAVMERLQIAF